MAYRLLSASKDTYVTDKIISQQRTPEANVGQAGTLDLFKLFNESVLSGTTAPIEIRERVTFGSEIVPDALLELTKNHGIDEAAIFRLSA